MSKSTAPPKPPTKVQKLRDEIYGPPLATFGPGWPSECQIVQNYLWFVEKKKAETNCKYIKDKNTLVNNVVDNLIQHWKRQPDPKIIDEKAERLQIFKRVKDLVQDYIGLENEVRNSGDKNWISNMKKQLESILDFETKSDQGKKRPIEEVSDTMSVGSDECYFPQDETDEEDDDCSPKTRNYQQYHQLVQTAKRFNISIRALWHVINSIMVDWGITDRSAYISYEKVRQMMKRYGDELEEEHDQTIGYEHIGYDGKKSRVLEAHNQFKVRDKQTICCQSRWSYIDHVIPEAEEGSDELKGGELLAIEIHNVNSTT